MKLIKEIVQDVQYITEEKTGGGKNVFIEGIFKGRRFERCWSKSDQIFYVSTKLGLSSSKFLAIKIQFYESKRWT